MEERKRPGPVTIPLSHEARQVLTHYRYVNGYTIVELAEQMKVSEQKLGGVLRGTRGSKREQHNRIMRFVKRIERKRNETSE